MSGRRSTTGDRRAALRDSAPDDARTADLLRRTGAGDRRAFQTLFEGLGERVFHYASRLIQDPETAREVTNDVMLEVWKNASRFEGRSKASTWILGITRNLAMNALRGRSLPLVDLEQVSEPMDEQARADGSNAERDAEKLRTVLHQALRELSPEHRDVVELTFFHGCTYPEIARIVGCPENTVKTRMYHAKRQLKRALVQRNVQLSLPQEALS